MEILDLGLLGYAEAAELQISLVEKIRQGAEDRLLLVEHPPVITFGHHGGEEFLLASKDYLSEKGIEVVKSSRGGKITCHYPGQLVAYPIINLFRWNKSNCALPQRGVRGLYYGLEETIIRSAKFFGLAAARRAGFPGVWLVEANGEPGHGKICSIGTAVRHGVTYHGLALNVAEDTSLFNLITLCGLRDARPASLCGSLGRSIPMQEVKNVVSFHFSRLFV